MPDSSTPLAARDRFVLVTGASRGIGAEIARCAAADGRSLIVSARSRDALDELADELRAAHDARVEVVTADLATTGGAAALADEIAAAGHTVDVLVNNAGFGLNGAFCEQPIDELEQMAVLNMVAPLVLARRLLPAMVEAGRGGVLNVASVAAFQPGAGMATYHATKAFVLSWSRAVRLELAGTGVSCTALCPGPVPTGFGERAGVTQRPGETLVHVSAADAARAGWRAFTRGDAQVVPGAASKLMVSFSRMLPVGVVERVTQRVWRT